jgi:ADP-ribosylation factor protein 1
MGPLFSRFSSLNWLLRQEPCRCVMLGLDAAGKTTMLYKLKLGEVVNTIPTIGFNVETVEYKSLKFVVWDVGGQDKLRPLWRHYYEGSEALIFIVDACDRERLHEARDTLHSILNDDTMRNVAVLVFANKMDKMEALSTADIAQKLNLHVMHRPWHIQGASAARGDGLYEGLDALSSMVKEARRK